MSECKMCNKGQPLEVSMCVRCSLLPHRDWDNVYQKYKDSPKDFQYHVWVEEYIDNGSQAWSRYANLMALNPEDTSAFAITLGLILLEAYRLGLIREGGAMEEGRQALAPTEHFTITEYCPHCEDEVELEPHFTAQDCPGGDHKILPCSICGIGGSGYNHCEKCPLKTTPDKFESLMPKERRPE